MKIIKVKSILYSLMAIAMVTVFLTSCEKQPRLEVDENVSQLETKSLDIFLPFDVASKSQKEIDKFLKESTYSEINTYRNNAFIFEFLQNENLLDMVISENTDVKLLSEISLSNYLSNEQTEELENKLLPISELESRDFCYKTQGYPICVPIVTNYCKKAIPLLPDVWYPCGWGIKCTTHYKGYWTWCP